LSCAVSISWRSFLVGGTFPRNDVANALDADNLESVVFWAQGDGASDAFSLDKAAFFPNLLLVVFDWA
jgi:hypothetical protein